MKEIELKTWEVTVAIPMSEEKLLENILHLFLAVVEYEYWNTYVSLL